jgi:hypothetical protein
MDTHKPEMLVRDADGNVTPIPVTTAPAHNYILGVDLQGDDIWVATAEGLSHGIRLKDAPTTKVTKLHEEKQSTAAAKSAKALR